MECGLAVLGSQKQHLLLVALNSDLPLYEGDSINTILVLSQANGGTAPLVRGTEMTGFVPDHTLESRVRVPLKKCVGHLRHLVVKSLLFSLSVSWLLALWRLPFVAFVAFVA